MSMSRENLDAVVVLVEENRRYLSSFTKKIVAISAVLQVRTPSLMNQPGH
jgi:hypothetical protein